MVPIPFSYQTVPITVAYPVFPKFDLSRLVNVHPNIACGVAGVAITGTGFD